MSMLFSRKSAQGRCHPGLFLLIPLVVLSLTSCGKLDPRKVNVDLPSDMPEVKETNFDKPLADLGNMTKVYGKRVMIQGKDIVDFTGLAQYASGEIPQDITEMSKSALNAIGGNVVYIPYSPVFVNNQMVTGYSNFQGKYIPDIVLSGGITEFDRGLETRGSNTDFGVTSKPFNVNPSWVPGDILSVDYNQDDRTSVARITLDFNLLDFKTLSGVAKMQTVNSINVYKAVAEKELAFTIFGPSFGLKGSVQKVQGRHAAIRLLVQSSVLQIVGKYLYLPYWKLIPGMQPDQVVLDKIRQDYKNLSQDDKIGEIQTCLYLKGYNVSVDTRLDSKTQAALSRFKPDYNAAQGVNDPELYVALWSSLSDNMEQVSNRRELLAKALGTSNPVERVASAPAKTAPAKAADKAATSKVAKQKAESNPGQKNTPVEKASGGPAAVARQSTDKAAIAAKETTIAKQQNAQDTMPQLVHSQPVLGNKNSAEARINERYMAE